MLEFGAALSRSPWDHSAYARQECSKSELRVAVIVALSVEWPFKSANSTVSSISQRLYWTSFAFCILALFMFCSPMKTVFFHENEIAFPVQIALIRTWYVFWIRRLLIFLEVKFLLIFLQLTVACWSYWLLADDDMHSVRRTQLPNAENRFKLLLGSLIAAKCEIKRTISISCELNKLPLSSPSRHITSAMAVVRNSPNSAVSGLLWHFINAIVLSGR